MTLFRGAGMVPRTKFEKIENMRVETVSLVLLKMKHESGWNDGDTLGATSPSALPGMGSPPSSIILIYEHY